MMAAKKERILACQRFCTQDDKAPVEISRILDI